MIWYLMQLVTNEPYSHVSNGFISGSSSLKFKEFGFISLFNNEELKEKKNKNDFTVMMIIKQRLIHLYKYLY